MAQAHEDQMFEVKAYKCYAQRATRIAARRAVEEAKKAKKADGWDDGIFYIAQPVNEEDKRGH